MTTPQEPQNPGTEVPHTVPEHDVHQPNIAQAGTPVQGMPPVAENASGAQLVTGQQKNGLSIAALVLGILSIVLFFLSWIAAIIGVVAVIFGVIGLRNAKKGLSNRRGFAMGGLVTGIIGIIIGVVIFAGAVAFLKSDTGKCLQNARGDQTKTEQCTK